LTIRETLALKQSEFAEFTRKIENLPIGAVRLELKKRRNAIGGEMVSLRQQLILEEVNAVDPQNVPRVSFGVEPAPEGEL
jgi:hypothetical protein